MRVFADFHHGALYYSFHLLFEKRLGWELYRPTGYEWFTKGFWRYSTNPTVIKQYLQPPDVPPKDGVYHVPYMEGTQRYVHKAITFQKFMEMDFDYIIASVYQHEHCFHSLAQMKNAVLIRQMGNPNEVSDFKIVRNVLNSTTNPVPPDVNQVHYHPEFSLEDFKYEPPQTHNSIKSFLNCLPHYPDAKLWYEYKEALPEFTWKMHGILGEDGLLPEKEKAKAMREASFIWHLKRQGDGYGFVVFQSYACGRPMIIKKSYYRGQMAEPLFTDSVTCIDLDLGTKKENVEKIRYFAKPENHVEMCLNAYKRFKEIVDFDKEFVAVKNFLERAKKGGN